MPSSSNHFSFNSSSFIPILSQKEVSKASRYGFNGKMKDNEVEGEGDIYDFSARMYDARLGRWLSVDPLTTKYAPISPYGFVLNNPILLIDGDGRVVIGADGKPVTYEKGNDGTVKWSSNATSDIIEVGNAMLSTKYGEASFNKWQNAKTEIKIVVDTDNEPKDKLADTDPEKNENGEPILNEDKQYKSAKVTFYKKSIDRDRKEGSGKRFEGASWEEALGAIGTHEEHHNEPGQIMEDLKLADEDKPETSQKPSKNLPINSEVNFRKEYQDNKPAAKETDEKGMKIYEQRGYKGLDKNEKPVK